MHHIALSGDDIKTANTITYFNLDTLLKILMLVLLDVLFINARKIFSKYNVIRD